MMTSRTDPLCQASGEEEESSPTGCASWCCMCYCAGHKAAMLCKTTERSMMQFHDNDCSFQWCKDVAKFKAYQHQWDNTYVVTASESY